MKSDPLVVVIIDVGSGEIGRKDRQRRASGEVAEESFKLGLRGLWVGDVPCCLLRFTVVNGDRSVGNRPFRQPLKVRLKRLPHLVCLVTEFSLGIRGKLNADNTHGPRGVWCAWFNVLQDTTFDE